MASERATAEGKLRVLRLAGELGSISAACRKAGISRDTFGRWKRAHTDAGMLGLEALSRRGRPNHKNRVQSDVESAVVALAMERPHLGQDRIASALCSQGHTVSPAGARAVLARHGIETFAKRLAALETRAPAQGEAASSPASCERFAADLAAMRIQLAQIAAILDRRERYRSPHGSRSAGRERGATPAVAPGRSIMRELFGDVWPLATANEGDNAPAGGDVAPAPARASIMQELFGEDALRCSEHPETGPNQGGTP